MLVCSVGHRMQTHRPIHNSYSIFDFVYGLMKTVRWVDCMDGSITSVARRPGAESASAAKLWSAAWRQRAAYRPIDNITPPITTKTPSIRQTLFTTNRYIWAHVASSQPRLCHAAFSEFGIVSACVSASHSENPPLRKAATVRDRVRDIGLEIGLQLWLGSVLELVRLIAPVSSSLNTDF